MLESLFNKAVGFASELMQYCKLKGRFTLPHCFYLLMKMKYFDVREFFLIIEKTLMLCYDEKLQINQSILRIISVMPVKTIIINFKHILIVESQPFTTLFSVSVQCRHY